jgi:Tol biopolymer transport system component
MLFVGCLALLSGLGAGTKKDNLPRLSNAALLVGYPPTTLMVTTPHGTYSLGDGSEAYAIGPTISRDGMMIASARPKSGFPGSPGPRLILAIAAYSVSEKKWTEYNHIQDFEGTIAISPDGSNLAFVLPTRPERDEVFAHIIDVKTGAEKTFPMKGYRDRVTLSWSPDGRRIAYDVLPKEFLPRGDAYPLEIEILDLDTGKTTKIADGHRPAWSPSGEWIAYFGVARGKWVAPPPPRNQLLLVRPDGTGSKVVVTLRGERAFSGAPLWSPDSKTILLNEVRDELKGTKDIHLLELATLKMTRRFKDVPPIFGWAEAK